jgi:4-amino-4-deoxy-L-arabinose transferase-like glycosyltransferase
VGINNMAGWWHYIINNAEAIRAGRGLEGTLYAPGQSLMTYLIFCVFPATPAVLRICFGILDAVAIVFVYLAGKEMLNSVSGLAAALFYSLWPEGASASVNILHDHSPQPLFLFAGLWCVLLWLRQQRWFLLILGGILLGLPALFRTDGVIVTLAVPLTILLLTLAKRGLKLSATAPAIALFLATLIPSLPYDLYLLHKTGRFVHIAAGDAWSSVFMRYGRTSGMGGTRYNDWEVAFVSGVYEPFGYAWEDVRRFRIPAQFGKTLFFTDPLKYLKIVALDTTPYLFTPAGYQYWLPPGSAKLGDVRLAHTLQNPDWPVAVFVSCGSIQTFLNSRPAILVTALFGLFGLIFAPRPVVIVAVVTVTWAGAQLILIPNPRYLMMPLCPLFLLMGVTFGSIPYFAKHSTRWLGAQGRIRNTIGTQEIRS